MILCVYVWFFGALVWYGGWIAAWTSGGAPEKRHWAVIPGLALVGILWPILLAVIAVVGALAHVMAYVMMQIERRRRAETSEKHS